MRFEKSAVSCSLRENQGSFAVCVAGKRALARISVRRAEKKEITFTDEPRGVASSQRQVRQNRSCIYSVS